MPQTCRLPALMLAASVFLPAQITVTSVVNEATAEPRLCPGVRVYIRGTRVVAGSPQSTIVTVGGRNGPVLGSLVDGALVAQIPAELPPGPASLVLSRDAEQSAPFPLNLEAVAPAIYSELRLDSGFAGTSIVPLLAAPGEIMQAWASCLGATNPPLTTNSQQKLPLVTPPLATVGGQPAEVVEAFHAGQGVYIVRFRVPPETGSGPARLVLQTAGQSSNGRDVMVSTRPIIRRIFHAANFEVSVAPGAIASIRAENLGAVDQLSGFPSTDFQGIRVTFNGIPAPIYHLVASARQINVQVPVELPTEQNVTVRVSSVLGDGNTWPIPVFSLNPGIFRVSLAGPFPGNGAILLANTAWRVMPAALARFLGIPASCRGLDPAALCGQPAAPGDIIQIYLTGLGRATPGGDPNAAPIGTGQIPPADGRPLYHTVVPANVRIGGRPAEVLFSGLAPGIAGLYQINARIPADAPTGDDVGLLVFMNEAGRGYSDSATLAIAPR